MSIPIPEHVRQPEDHLKSLDERYAAVVTDDELLADMPELKPPHKLRIRDRNKVMKLAYRMRDFLPEQEGGAEQPEKVEFDFDNLSDEQFDRMLDLMADVDDFAESIAINQAEYLLWSEGTAGYEHMSAILGRYSSAVGESTSSSI